MSDVRPGAAPGGVPSAPPPVRSEFADRSADEVADGYLAWFRRTRALYVAAAVVLGVVAIAGLLAFDSWPTYLVGLAAVVGLAMLIRLQVNRRFAALAAILNTDCDVEKWRRVVERVREHGLRHRRSRALCDVYLSTADCEGLRYRDALDRLAGVDPGRSLVLGLGVLQNRAVCARELGDEVACDESVAALRLLVGRRRPGSKARSLAEAQLADLVVRLKAPEAWDGADEAHAHTRHAAAASHRELVTWSLALAARCLAAGDVAGARALLDERVLAPMTPRQRLRREELAGRLAAGATSGAAGTTEPAAATAGQAATAATAATADQAAPPAAPPAAPGTAAAT